MHGGRSVPTDSRRTRWLRCRRAAFVFVSDWARQFDSQVWFIQLTEESARRRREIVTDVSRRGRRMANQFTVSGATVGARNQQLVSGIAEAAQTFGADLIVVGLDRHRLTQNRFTRSVREQLAASTDVPVLIAPIWAAGRNAARRPRANAIPLGPASCSSEMADVGGLARV